MSYFLRRLGEELGCIVEGRRGDLRLFAGLRSFRDINSVINKGMLPNPAVGGIYFADNLRGAYDYRSYHGEDRYAVVEILVTPGHGSLIDRELDLGQAQDDEEIDPRLRQSIARYLSGESELDELDYVGRKSWYDRSLPKHRSDELAAKYTRARGSTSGDMAITHNMGFKGRPRIVAIYLIAGEHEETAVVAKPYDKGEGSYEVGHILGKPSAEKELVSNAAKTAAKYFDYIKDDMLHYGDYSYAGEGGRLVIRRGGEVVGEFELSLKNFTKALVSTRQSDKAA